MRGALWMHRFQSERQHTGNSQSTCEKEDFDPQPAAAYQDTDNPLI